VVEVGLQGPRLESRQKGREFAGRSQPVKGGQSDERQPNDNFDRNNGCLQPVVAGEPTPAALPLEILLFQAEVARRQAA
jgi:hypothetical protein